MNKSRMGKGLEALLKKDKNIMEDFQELDINKIEPGNMQTRQYFDDKQLEELAETIKTTGILQPIIVYKYEDKFKIISGERRFRASKIAKLNTIPARIVSWSDEQILNANILENVQRAQLNGIEEALAYKRFMDEYHLTQEEIATKVGKSRSHVANLLRLLKLPKEVQKLICDGSLTVGHGKMLLQECKSEREMIIKALNIVKKNSSIQESFQTDLQKKFRLPNTTEIKLKSNGNAANSAEYNSIAENLSNDIGYNVKIERNGKDGRVSLMFNNDIELDAILEFLYNAKSKH